MHLFRDACNDGDLMQAKRRQGRKPSAKPYQQGSAERVVYYRRVSPEQVQQLDSVLAGLVSLEILLGQTGICKKAVAEPVAVVTPKEDVKALLEDVDRLTKEVVSLTERLNRCAQATDDEKARHWMHRALKAEAAQKGGSEFDQTV